MLQNCCCQSSYMSFSEGSSSTFRRTWTHLLPSWYKHVWSPHAWNTLQTVRLKEAELNETGPKLAFLRFTLRPYRIPAACVTILQFIEVFSRKSCACRISSHLCSKPRSWWLFVWTAVTQLGSAKPDIKSWINVAQHTLSKCVVQICKCCVLLAFAHHKEWSYYSYMTSQILY